MGNSKEMENGLQSVNQRYELLLLLFCDMALWTSPYLFTFFNDTVALQQWIADGNDVSDPFVKVHPVHLASFMGHHECVVALLEHDPALASIEITVEGDDPLWGMYNCAQPAFFAKVAGFNDIASLLEQ